MRAKGVSGQSASGGQDTAAFPPCPFAALALPSLPTMRLFCAAVLLRIAAPQEGPFSVSSSPLEGHSPWSRLPGRGSGTAGLPPGQPRGQPLHSLPQHRQRPPHRLHGQGVIIIHPLHEAGRPQRSWDGLQKVRESQEGARRPGGLSSGEMARFIRSAVSMWPGEVAVVVPAPNLTTGKL